MLNENAKKWVAALRSGKYAQAKHKLRTSEGFCCLGVACDLFSATKWEKHGDVFWFGGDENVLPDDVKDWLGLQDRGSHYYDHDASGFDQSTQLSAQNDKGKTFAQIADIIESEPEGLFVK